MVFSPVNDEVSEETERKEKVNRVSLSVRQSVETCEFWLFFVNHVEKAVNL